jgi:hypothetical protein
LEVVLVELRAFGGGQFAPHANEYIVGAAVPALPSIEESTLDRTRAKPSPVNGSNTHSSTFLFPSLHSFCFLFSIMMNDTDEHEHQHSLPFPEEVKTDLNFQLLQFGAGDFSTATQTSDVHCFDIEKDSDASLHSLPLVEEIKMNLNSSTHLKKRWIVFGLFLLIGIPCFIGTMVAVGRKAQVPAASLATATNSRLESAINFLSDEVSTRELLEKNGTAQNEAVKWISNIDDANLDVPSFKGSVDGPAFIQRYLLAVFYTALKGESWTANLAFLSGNPVCYWHEVFNSNLGKYTVGASCNEMSQVTTLFIRKFPFATQCSFVIHGQFATQCSLIALEYCNVYAILC